MTAALVSAGATKLLRAHIMDKTMCQSKEGLSTDGQNA